MRRRGTHNLDDIRRELRLGMGPCQGGFCIYRATGILHGLDGMTGEQANGALLQLPAGALEGHVADPLRRPAAPGAAGRLDLPGRPRRGAPAVVRGELHFDAVVIGAGSAGLTAATRLAEGGARVCVLAKGIGSTHLAPGTVDVLGYAPERVEEPARALSELAAARPDHPYALMGVESVAPALQWFAERIADGPQPGYRYVGDLEHNHLLPTAVGVLRPSALVPETMAEGDMRRREPVCIVGTRALRDFHAALCAANLEAAGDRGARDRGRSRARSRRRQRARPRAALRRPRLPRRVRGASSRRACTATSASALPAVLGLRDPHGAWADLQRRLGRGVFEIPTLPPSVPGMRAFEALRDRAARARAGASILGSEVIGAERDGARVSAVRAHAAGHDVALPRALVRARHGRLRLGRHRAGLGLGHARDGARPAAARRPRSRRAALRGRLPGRAADGARGGGGRRRRCAPRAPRTCSSPAPRCPAPCRGRRARARASRWPAATAPRRSCWPRASKVKAAA